MYLSKNRSIHILGLIVLGTYILLDNGIRYNICVLLQSFIISVYCFFIMLQDNDRPYSLHKILHIFFLFFIGIAPAVQFKQDLTIWGSVPFSSVDYLQMNLMFGMVLIVYTLTYNLVSVQGRALQFYFLSDFFRNRRLKNDLLLKSLILLLSLSSFFIYLYFKKFNFLAIFVRGGSGTEDVLDTSIAKSLFIKIFIRPIPVICLLFYRIYLKKFNFFEFLLLLLVLVSNAPTGMSRFQAAALYIPMVLIYFKPFQRGNNFTIALVGGVLFLFPFLNLFRHFDGFDKINANPQGMFLSGHFDSYANFMSVLREGMVTYGEQLLGVLFFFVPRDLWPDKPVGSGHYLATELGYEWTNISMNFFGEGYINFGIIGVIAFSLFLAYFNSILDRSYWEGGEHVVLRICYLFLLGMEFFILRGDLLSSFAYTVSLLLSVLFVFVVITKKRV